MVEDSDFKLAVLPKIKGDVYVSHGEHGYKTARETLDRIPFDFSKLENKRILVKPNAGRFVSPRLGINTSPEVVAAVLDFFLEKGLNNIAVGDSPILGVKALEALEKCGIASVATDRGVPLVDLDAENPVIVPVPEPRVVKSLKVCREALEADFIVSVPVMKTHMHTRVSLGLKNMKGCLYKREKVRLHQLPPLEEISDSAKPLDVAISDLAKILLPDLTVIDGTTGQEGLGPSAGTPKKFGAVVCSMNCLAADLVSSQLMGMDPGSVLHLGLAISELERFGAKPREFQVFPPDYRKWTVPFQPPPKKISFEFNNVRVEDVDSCSACLSTVLMFLVRYQRELADYFTEENPLKLAIGKGIGPQKGDTLLIGNCTVSRKEEGVFIRGCPPVASDILRALKENSGFGKTKETSNPGSDPGEE